jgi:hypothetical protein
MIVSLSYQEKVGPYEKLFWFSNGSMSRLKALQAILMVQESKVILLMQLKKRYGKIIFYLGFSICNFILDQNIGQIIGTK